MFIHFRLLLIICWHNSRTEYITAPPTVKCTTTVLSTLLSSIFIMLFRQVSEHPFVCFKRQKNKDDQEEEGKKKLQQGKKMNCWKVLENEMIFCCWLNNNINVTANQFGSIFSCYFCCVKVSFCAYFFTPGLCI